MGNVVNPLDVILSLLGNRSCSNEAGSTSGGGPEGCSAISWCFGRFPKGGGGPRVKAQPGGGEGNIDPKMVYVLNNKWAPGNGITNHNKPQKQV